MELPEAILLHLSQLPTDAQTNSIDLASKLGADHQKIVGAIKCLQSFGSVIETEELRKREWELTEEGRDIADHGSHECRLLAFIPADGSISQSSLMSTFAHAKVGFNKAMSNGWLAIDKQSGEAQVSRKQVDVVDEVQALLRKISNLNCNDISDKQKQDMKRRKLVNEATVVYYGIRRGTEFTTSLKKAETDLSAEMLASGSWQSATFKPYNFEALGVTATGGYLHPLLKVRSEYRQIFLEMGFTEMPTNNFVESSFWNFDALFQPQQHPSRDAHDTFFVSNPSRSLLSGDHPPQEYIDRVATVHSEGGWGSQGYKYEWKLEEAQKNLLRTHTTAVSARMLYALAQRKPFAPVKYFSIDRVFRNEALDATHLAEFHQIEGVVADYGLTLGHLMGAISQFFNKLGIKRLRFKPAYNPYTEPSMEIFSYHDGLKKWVEIGNSGIFRPEMLLPMGLPPGVAVIAWGLSLERPTMIKYAISNIRDLIGPKVNLHMVQTNPICRLDH